MTDAAKLDPLKIAAQIAHGAAVNVLLAFGADNDAADWWSNAGSPRAGDPFDVADRLAASFCSSRSLADARSAPLAAISGERVWREAAEAHLHGLGGNAWAQQDVAIVTAFSVFGQVAFSVWRDLDIRRTAALAHEAAKKRAAARKPTKITDTIYEPLDDRNARDPSMVKALKRRNNVAAPAKPPVAASPAGGEPRPVRAPGKAAAARPQEAGGAGGATGKGKLSIGERPLDMAKQRKGKHGGKRERK
jgi:hypothetical protein